MIFNSLRSAWFSATQVLTKDIVMSDLGCRYERERALGWKSENCGAGLGRGCDPKPNVLQFCSSATGEVTRAVGLADCDIFLVPRL